MVEACKHIWSADQILGHHWYQWLAYVHKTFHTFTYRYHMDEKPFLTTSSAQLPLTRELGSLRLVWNMWLKYQLWKQIGGLQILDGIFIAYIRNIIYIVILYICIYVLYMYIYIYNLFSEAVSSSAKWESYSPSLSNIKHLALSNCRL